MKNSEITTSTSMKIEVICVRKTSWTLKVDDKLIVDRSWKDHVRRQLKIRYNIDLWTDRTIIRTGYIERTTKKVAEKDGVKLFINKNRF